jgi:hypothetical protein
MERFFFRIVPKVSQNAGIGQTFIRIEARVIAGLESSAENCSDLGLKGLLIIPIVADPGLVGTFPEVNSFKRSQKSVIISKAIDFYEWRYADQASREVLAKRNIIDSINDVSSRYLSMDTKSFLASLV